MISQELTVTGLTRRLLTEPVAFGSGGRSSHTATTRKKPQPAEITASGNFPDPHASHQAAGTIRILADTLADAVGQPLGRLLGEPYLTIRGVAERVGVSTATVYALCRRGELGHYRISNAIRIPESALAKYLTAASTTPDTTEIAEQS